MRNLRSCLLDGCRCTDGFSDSCECPALAKAGSLLLPLVLENDFVCRSWWPQLLWQERRAAVPALTALGRSRGSWSCRSSGQGLHHSLGRGLSSHQRTLPWKRREAEGERAARFSCWVSYQVLCQCVFHPQSSQALVEISAFAVAQLGHIVLPCGWIWLAQCHVDHTNLRLLLKDSGIFISYLGFHSQLPFFKRLFLLLSTRMYREASNQIFPFLCLNQGLQSMARQFVSANYSSSCLFVCVWFYVLILVFYQIISQSSSRLLCLVSWVTSIYRGWSSLKTAQGASEISHLQCLESSPQLVREGLIVLSTGAAVAQAPERAQIIDKHSHEKAFLICSLFCISLIKEMSENGITVFFSKTTTTHITINLQRWGRKANKVGRWIYCQMGFLWFSNKYWNYSICFSDFPYMPLNVAF